MECHRCGKEFTPRGMKRHLAACKGRARFAAMDEVVRRLDERPVDRLFCPCCGTDLSKILELLKGGNP
jgi:hypothetical protein